MNDLKQYIKQLANEIGFEQCGFARVSPLGTEFQNYLHWLELGFDADMEYLSKHLEKRKNPLEILPNAKTVIVLAHNYKTPFEYPEVNESVGFIARYAWGDDYHVVLKEKATQIMQKLSQIVDFDYKIYVDTGPILERAWAVRSGIGWQGKNGNIINFEMGSYMFLCVVLVSLELDEDSPAMDYCGTCQRCILACPTGAIVPKSEVAEVWKAIEDKSKVVVAQIAPAVRVAIGEEFGYKSGTIVTGQLIAALKMLGFDKVFDSSFTADLTVIEEANEFIERKTNNENLPLFTSCCPAWVKYVEQYFPEYLHNLSTCRSPQQMFGSIAKSILPDLLGKKREDIVVVSIMPCTAKKVEARRPEFTTDGIQDVDYVLTTQELANMIKQVGIKFENLSPEAFDLPLGFKTGAGVLFGNSGGVSEAVLRYAYEKISGQILDNVDFKEVRGNDAVRETSIQINGQTINLCIIYGLKNAKNVVKQIQNGEKHYDLIEVMACPGGCIGGAGQPVYYDEETRTNRTKGIYDCDKMLQLYKSQENPYVADLYKNILKEPNSEVAHNLLHTHYKSRKRIIEGAMELISSDNSKLQVSVCVGTNCFIKGSQEILKKLINYVEENNLTDTVDIKANFCMENCDEGPSVTIGDKLLKKCSAQSAIKTLETLVSQIA